MTNDTDASQLGLADLQSAVEFVEEQVAEQRRLLARQERAEADLHEASRAVTHARAMLAEENADVARLESFSPARIWAGLRGERDAELDRERSEQQAAEYAVAVAEHRHELAANERDAAARLLADLADVHIQYEQALRAKEQWLHRHRAAASDELADLGRAIGAARVERNEIIEALHAAAATVAALNHASHSLRAAESTSSSDGVLGGALYFQRTARLDESTRLMHAANAALHHLNQELADAGLPAIDYVWIDRLDRTWDFTIESTFMPRLSEKQRIATAQDQVQAAHEHVVAADRDLRDRLADADERLGRSASRREELLVG